MLETLKQQEPPTPWMHFHWQNLNDRKDGTQGSGLRHGRCWWRFGNHAPIHERVVKFSWNLWTHFCGIEFNIDEEDITLMLAFPPVAFWVSFSTGWPLIAKLVPRKPLNEQTYPGVIVIDERSCGIKIHSGRLWILPWSKRDEWVKADPWWVRGVSFSINPFEAKHISHEVRKADGTWAPYVGSWEHDKEPDGREEFTYPYRYVLKNGTVQDRIATVHVERWEWRPRCLRWTSLFANVRISIDVRFSEEVGERSGSWKGGCIGCAYHMQPNETPLQALRRMEQDRKF